MKRVNTALCNIYCGNYTGMPVLVDLGQPIATLVPGNPPNQGSAIASELAELVRWQWILICTSLREHSWAATPWSFVALMATSAFAAITLVRGIFPSHSSVTPHLSLCPHLWVMPRTLIIQYVIIGWIYSVSFDDIHMYIKGWGKAEPLTTYSSCTQTSCAHLKWIMLCLCIRDIVMSELGVRGSFFVFFHCISCFYNVS